MTPVNSQLASAAVYRSLYEKNYDIQSVICPFVLYQYLEWGKLKFTSIEMSNRLRRESGFNIPSSVIQEALLSKGQFFFTYDKKDKTFCKADNCPEDTIKELRDLIELKKQENEDLINNLISYISKRNGKPISDYNYTDVSNSLSGFLLGTCDNIYSELISEFLISQNADSPSVRQLQSIKEGYIFLEGISQEIVNPDIYSNFNVPLTLYLETEILFHIGGLNGEDYAKIGNEFIETIKEINNKSKNSKPIIRLRFFPETEEEIKRYFSAAESIVSTGKMKQNSGTAMVTIVTKCKYKYEVEILRAQFMEDLKSKGIVIDSDTNYRPYNSDMQWLNIEDQKEINRMQNEFEEKWMQDEIADSLRLINYIHSKRSNVRRDRGYLKIGHLLISGKGVTFAVASSISQNEKIRTRNEAPFVASIERITNLLWLSLSKQLREGDSLPSSMDIIIHAQAFIHKELEGHIKVLYKQLNEEMKNGNFDEQTTSNLALNLYYASHKPENITQENITSVTHLLSLKSINDYNEMLKEKQSKHDELMNNLSRLQEEKENAEKKVIITENQLQKYQKEIAKGRLNSIMKIRRIRCVLRILCYFFLIGAAISILWAIYEIISQPNFSWKKSVISFIPGIVQSLIATLILQGKERIKNSLQ